MRARARVQGRRRTRFWDLTPAEGGRLVLEVEENGAVVLTVQGIMRHGLLVLDVRDYRLEDELES